MAVSLDKLAQQAPGLVDMRKKADQAAESAGLPDDHRAKVTAVLDYSGSMTSTYGGKGGGPMQLIAERVLALASKFDDDDPPAVDMIFFGSGAKNVGTVGLTDYQGSVDRLRRGMHFGSTNYLAALDEIEKLTQERGRFGRKKESDLPVFALFFTDGSPDDPEATAKRIVTLARKKIFIQFIGLNNGYADFWFLETLDDPAKYLGDTRNPMKARIAAIVNQRAIDNCGFAEVAPSISDADLYRAILQEYPKWLAEVS